MPAKKAAAEKVEKKAKAAKGDKPKRAPTPYILFCSEMRAKVKEENEGAGFGELGKLLGIKWGELDEKGKAVSEHMLQWFSLLETRTFYAWKFIIQIHAVL